MSTRTTSRNTVRELIAAWEIQYDLVLPCIPRDKLVTIFTEVVDQAVDVTIDETIKLIENTTNAEILKNRIKH